MKVIMTTVTTGITMTDCAGGLYKLMTWLSPAFPVGAFSHSSGLENAIDQKLIHDRNSMRAWVAELLVAGNLWSDAVIFARSYDAAAQGDIAALDGIGEFANAFPGTAELRGETRALGAAFAEAAKHGWNSAALDEIEVRDLPYPAAIAVMAADNDIECRTALGAFIHAAAANLVSVAVRLVPLGHSDGVKLIAALEPAIQSASREAIATPLENLTTNCLMSEIASMRHETQRTRLFRT
jgi:urease accessory protein